MTSDDTDAKTRELVEKKGRYGMAEGQIIIVMQDKVCDDTTVYLHFFFVADVRGLCFFFFLEMTYNPRKNVLSIRDTTT